MTSNTEPPGIGELQRALQAVLVRFEGLATKMDTQFVQKENFHVWQKLFDETIKGIRDTIRILSESKGLHITKEEVAEKIGRVQQDMDKKASKGEVNDLRQDIKELQDDKKWLIRLVVGVIILAVLTLVVTQSAGGGL